MRIQIVCIQFRGKHHHTLGRKCIKQSIEQSGFPEALCGKIHYADMFARQLRRRRIDAFASKRRLNLLPVKQSRAEEIDISRVLNKPKPVAGFLMTNGAGALCSHWLSLQKKLDMFTVTDQTYGLS